MPRYKKYKLNELVAKANTGLDAIKRAPIVPHDTGIKCLRIQDVSQGKDFKDWGFTEVTKENYERFALKKGEIILARTGNTIGVNIFIDKDLHAVFNNGLIRLRTNKQKCDPKYLYFNMQTTNYWSHIDSIAFGTSTQPNMQIESFLEYEIEMPDLPTQTRIATILSSLDDKIELNRRTDHTLEQIAQTLFKKYFVDDIDSENLPVGWRSGRLDDEFDITMGQSPEGTSYNENRIGTPFFQGRTDFDFRFPSFRIYTTSPKRYAKQFDVLLSVRAPVGDLNLALTDCCIGRGIASLRQKDNKLSYGYYKLKTLNEAFAPFNGEGTVFGSINKEELAKIPVTIPPKNRIEEYDNLASPIDYKIYQLYNETNSLMKIRDSLLPKLMSGEIEMNAAVKELAKL